MHQVLQGAAASYGKGGVAAGQEEGGGAGLAEGNCSIQGAAKQRRTLLW